MKVNDRLPTVDRVQVIAGRGPWDTKSGGKLNVMFAMPLSGIQDQYFRYDDAELGQMPSDIRGLRAYTVRDLPNGRIGGTEWHRIREEMVFMLEGSVHWICEDLKGDQIKFDLEVGMGIWMPSHILHTYEVTQEGSGFLVMANTLFDPDDPRTHDTYSMESFRELQSENADPV